MLLRRPIIIGSTCAIWLGLAGSPSAAPSAGADCASLRLGAAALLDAAQAPLPLRADETLEAPDRPAAYVAALRPETEITYPVASKRIPTEGARGGIFAVSAPAAAGLIDIALSDRAWIDVVQAGSLIPSTDHSGAAGCRLHKVVRFKIAAAPFSISISGAKVGEIIIAVAPVADAAAAEPGNQP